MVQPDLRMPSLCLVILVIVIASSPVNCQPFACRSNRVNVTYKDLRDFSLDMCAQCYHYMDIGAIKTEFTFEGRKSWLYSTRRRALVRRNVTGKSDLEMKVDYDSFNLTHSDSDPILKTFRNTFFMVSIHQQNGINHIQSICFDFSP